MSATVGDAKVLVVDDSAVVRAVVASCLKRAGYEVAMADGGAAALKLLGATTFDVVITDLNMPGMNGIEMLRRIRVSAQSPEVIIQTGSGARDVECAVEALRLGAHDYLTKPPKSGDVILCAVEKALEKKRLRDENLRLLESQDALVRVTSSAAIASTSGEDDRDLFAEADAALYAAKRAGRNRVFLPIQDLSPAH
jgi:PleD family two-component response regulator